jgi:hypothetical protein
LRGCGPEGVAESPREHTSTGTSPPLLTYVNNTPFYFLPSFLSPNLRCWLTNRRWCQLQSQQSAGALTSNQLLPNASLERDEKALIDLVDGLSSLLCHSFRKNEINISMRTWKHIKLRE